jgi:hypothetical protein
MPNKGCAKVRKPEARDELKAIRRIDWEAIAGITAAVVALVLHLVHVADEPVLLAVALVILALLLLRNLRSEASQEALADATRAIAEGLHDLQRQVQPADTVLIGPQHLLEESERFGRRAQGEMQWFNVCLSMFSPQPLFDVLLRPALDNSRVTSVQFILDEGERERWASLVVPKATAVRRMAKLKEPIWTKLEETVSFILSDTDRGTEAQLSFWGEPFMSRTRGGQVPRYIFHVQPGSELIGRLAELARGHRVASR